MMEENSRVPVNRAMKMPSTIVYRDMTTIMQMLGREKRSREAVVNCRARA